MALCGVEKQKNQVSAVPKRLPPTAEDLTKEARGIATKPDCMNEFRKKVAQAIEANNLCYDCKTGFHYMK